MPENQRVRLSKKLLKESLIGLLGTNNIHSISVREICEAAQINRTTFYKYYGSQYDLLGDMENDVLAEIDRYLGPAERQTDMRSMLTQIFSYFDENFDLCRILLSNNIDPDLPEKIIRRPQIRELVAQSMKNRNEEELGYILHFMIDGSFSLLKGWINKENREPESSIAELLTQIMMKLSA